MQYQVKRGQIVKTSVGKRIKCPYCHLLFDLNEVPSHGLSKMCPNKACNKAYVMEAS